MTTKSTTFTLHRRPLSWARASSTTGGRRVTTREQRAYKGELGMLYLAAGGRSLGDEARVTVRVSILARSARRQDIDNIAKGVLDALNGVAYADDSQIDRLVVERSRGTRDELTVTVSPITEDEMTDEREDRREVVVHPPAPRVSVALGTGDAELLAQLRDELGATAAEVLRRGLHALARERVELVATLAEQRGGKGGA